MHIPSPQFATAEASRPEVAVERGVHTSREAWLQAAVEAFRPAFVSHDAPLPSTVRVAIGFPSTGRRGKRVGECWSAAASADGHHEIFIRPDQHDAVEILAILIHELAHAALPAGVGHGPEFRILALALGMMGPMRSTRAGDGLRKSLAALASDLGEFPHGRLDHGLSEKKKQSTRLIKARCGECGYTIRLARIWADRAWCRDHGKMIVDMK